MRYLIRCPLLPALTAAIALGKPAGPRGYPDIFWVFVLVATREFGKNDHLLQELKGNWTEIAKEFFFEHGVELPVQRGVAFASFNSWRTNAFLDRYHQLDIFLGVVHPGRAPSSRWRSEPPRAETSHATSSAPPCGTASLPTAPYATHPPTSLPSMD